MSEPAEDSRRRLPPAEPVPSYLVPLLFAPTGVEGEPENDAAVLEVAWLLWQVNQGAIKAEDRAIGTNWFLEPVDQLLVDDQAERPHWIALAREVMRLTAEHIRQLAYPEER
jgi:hypothetical protein